MALSFPGVTPMGTNPYFSGGGSYGGNKKPMSITDIFFKTKPSDFVLGTPVSGGGHTAVSGGGVTGAAAPVVNSANVDGSSMFLSAISNFGSALLAGIGGEPEAQPPATVHPASYNPMAGGVFDVKTLLLIGAAGVAVYYVAKS